MKTLSGTFIAVLMVVFLSANVFSQIASTTVPEKKPAKATTTVPGNFVDKNSNGICDNHESCKGGGQGKNFTDKNGDGKCDNCTGKGTGDCCGKGGPKGNCCGKGQPSGNGCGNGCGHGYQKHGCSPEPAKSTPPSK